MIRVLDGDMRDVVPTLDRIDCVVTDPPYHLTSGNAVYDLDKTSAGTPRVRRHARGGGFMGKQWDGGTLAFEPDTWWPVFTALKPGGHLVAFGGTRTFHRLVCAIEDAGFEIRDTLMWVYGSGFPKSLDISKQLDKQAGATREVVGKNPNHRPMSGVDYCGVYSGGNTGAAAITAPATPEAVQWQGWGSALKPAWEPIILARKPLEGTLAQNTLKHGVGGLNIDACRVPLADDDALQAGITGRDGAKLDTATNEGSWGFKAVDRAPGLGRWPANVLLDGSDEVLAAFAAYGERTSGRLLPRHDAKESDNASMSGKNYAGRIKSSFDSSTGSAARFFFSAKADKADRADSRHPTVKPVDLMVWLTKLVCPPGGTVLDPFAGSGTTAEACMRNGFDCILVEKNPEYCRDIRHRIRRWSGEDSPLFAAVAD